MSLHPILLFIHFLSHFILMNHVLFLLSSQLFLFLTILLPSFYLIEIYAWIITIYNWVLFLWNLILSFYFVLFILATDCCSWKSLEQSLFLSELSLLFLFLLSLFYFLWIHFINYSIYHISPLCNICLRFHIHQRMKQIFYFSFSNERWILIL